MLIASCLQLFHFTIRTGKIQSRRRKSVEAYQEIFKKWGWRPPRFAGGNAPPFIQGENPNGK